MFNWFKPKKPSKQESSVKSTVELKHTNGEVVKITIEGTNIKQVAFVSNRIKGVFGQTKDPFSSFDFDGQFKKATAEIDRIMDEIEATFKKK
jgi:hypothetical protein